MVREGKRRRGSAYSTSCFSLQAESKETYARAWKGEIIVLVTYCSGSANRSLSAVVRKTACSQFAGWLSKGSDDKEHASRLTEEGGLHLCSPLNGRLLRVDLERAHSAVYHFDGDAPGFALVLKVTIEYRRRVASATCG